MRAAETRKTAPAQPVDSLAAGSGKTHTLFGTAAEAGLVPMLAEELFQRLEASPADTSWKVECSFVEIYNERARGP